jgi:superfamily II DNA/RNA helicase
MIGRRNLRTRNIKMFILDEADEMLNKGISFETSKDGIPPPM